MSIIKKVFNQSSFILTGLTTYLRLHIVNECLDEGKNVVLLTSTELNAQKYQSDIKKIFNKDGVIFPYQSISPYELLYPDFYELSAQIQALTNPPNLIIAPIRGFMETFPDISFYKNNALEYKKGDEITPQDLAKKLVKLGYRRVTMVSDACEFSIRGDIADIYSFTENPVRIEFWGDEIVDIRYFNNETQRSIEKINKCTIYPMFKFILPDKSADIPDFLEEQIQEEGYFEGINVYQNYFNKELYPVSEYFKNYTYIIDEYSEIITRLEALDENFNNQLAENVKTELIKPITGKNHISAKDFINSIAGTPKIYLNNFLDDTELEVTDLNALSIPLFDANFEKAAEYINKNTDYRIIIATDYPDRVKEELSEFGIFNFNLIECTSAPGCIIKELKLLYITDRELFNKTVKNISSKK